MKVIGRTGSRGQVRRVPRSRLLLDPPAPRRAAGTSPRSREWLASLGATRAPFPRTRNRSASERASDCADGDGRKKEERSNTLSSACFPPPFFQHQNNTGHPGPRQVPGRPEPPHHAQRQGPRARGRHPHAARVGARGAPLAVSGRGRAPARTPARPPAACSRFSCLYVEEENDLFCVCLLRTFTITTCYAFQSGPPQSPFFFFFLSFSRSLPLSLSVSLSRARALPPSPSPPARSLALSLALSPHRRLRPASSFLARPLCDPRGKKQKESKSAAAARRSSARKTPGAGQGDSNPLSLFAPSVVGQASGRAVGSASGLFAPPCPLLYRPALSLYRAAAAAAAGRRRPPCGEEPPQPQTARRRRCQDIPPLQPLSSASAPA